MLHSHSIGSTILEVLLSNCLAVVAIYNHLLRSIYILDRLTALYHLRYHNSFQRPSQSPVKNAHPCAYVHRWLQLGQPYSPLVDEQSSTISLQNSPEFSVSIKSSDDTKLYAARPNMIMDTHITLIQLLPSLLLMFSLHEGQRQLSIKRNRRISKELFILTRLPPFLTCIFIFHIISVGRIINSKRGTIHVAPIELT